MPGWLTAELIWFLAGIILILLEFMVPGVLLVFFGVGALLTALLVWLGVTGGALGQLVFFSVSSLALLFGLRRFAAGFFRGDTSGESDSEYEGKTARAVTAIEPGSIDGRVFFEGTDWKAESSVSIPRGAPVRITGKRNITLFVEPLKAD